MSGRDKFGNKGRGGGGGYRGGGNRGRFAASRSGGGGSRGDSPGFGGGGGGGAPDLTSRGSIMRSQMARRREEDAAFDARMGFGAAGADAPQAGERVGYLYQMLPAVVTSEDRLELAALDMFFIQEDGIAFKGTLTYNPYFYVALQASQEGLG